MSQRLIRDLAILIALFGAAWLAFSFFFDEETQIEAGVSVEDEKRIGRFILRNVVHPEQVVHIATVDSAVKAIQERLVKGLGKTAYTYNFIVVNDSRVNAYALPGGNIVIHSGMIKFAESPEELAAVLSHEIGHVEERHVIMRLIKEFGLTALFAIFTNNGTLAEISKAAVSLAYDRKQEQSADAFGFKLMVKSNLDPKHFADLFQRVSDKYGENGNVAEVFSSHPDNAKRMKAAREFKLPKDFKEKPFSTSIKNWRSVQNAVDHEVDYSSNVYEDDKP